MKTDKTLVPILKLKPVLVERIWGGTWLKTEFGFKTKSQNIGEAWVISAHRSGDCPIVNGPFKGQTLSEVYHEHRELFANDRSDTFPLLIKLIDAKDDLSVQVHPGDQYAQRHERQSGKSEAWIILGAHPDSRILVGHNAKSREQLKDLINAQKWDKLLTYRPLKKDEVINIPSGTVHAICAGTSLIEVQQSSDVTYRLYDYDRVDDKGHKRELHLAKAMDVIDVPHKNTSQIFLPSKPVSNVLVKVLTTPYFKISTLVVDGEYNFHSSIESYYLVTILSGIGQVDSLKVKKGNSFIITSQSNSVKIRGQMRMIIATK